MMQTINNKTAGAVARKIMALTLAIVALVGLNLATVTAQNYAPQNRHTGQNNYTVLVSSRVGGFHALMPGEAKYTSSPVTLKDGSKIIAHYFIHETADRKYAYGVTYGDFVNRVTTGNLDRVFNDAARGSAESINGRIVKMTAMMQNGYPARLVKIETDKQIAYNKMILVGKRFYQVTFIMQKNASVPDAAVKFFNSFRIA